MLKKYRHVYRLIVNWSMFTFILLLLLLMTSCEKTNDVLFLTVTDSHSGKVYQELEVKQGHFFVLRYRHSVSGSIVKGTFLIVEDELIEPVSTEYSSFGPGLPLDSFEIYKIEDGVITVYHDEEPREKIKLWVSSYTEETLLVNELEIPLFKPEVSHLLLEIRVVK